MSRARIMAVAGAIAMALSLGTAGVATAGTPSPDPTVQTQSPNPFFHKQFGRPWTFDVQRSTFGPVVPTIVNRVDGVRAIPMDRWRETDLSPNVSVFRSVVNPANSVTLWHSALPLPQVFLPTCTLTFDQTGLFRIIAGTGIAAGLRSQGGIFRLNGLVSFPFINVHKFSGRQVCVLRFLSLQRLRLAVILNLIAGTPFPVVQPTLLDFNEQGFARVFRAVPFVTPTPYVTPTVPASLAPAAAAHF